MVCITRTISRNNDDTVLPNDTRFPSCVFLTRQIIAGHVERKGVKAIRVVESVQKIGTSNWQTFNDPREGKRPNDVAPRIPERKYTNRR